MPGARDQALSVLMSRLSQGASALRCRANLMAWMLLAGDLVRAVVEVVPLG